MPNTASSEPTPGPSMFPKPNAAPIAAMRLARSSRLDRSATQACDAGMFAEPNTPKIARDTTISGHIHATGSTEIVPRYTTVGKDTIGLMGGLAFGDGKLFVSSGFGKIRALDPATGGEIWLQDLDAPATGTPAVSRGLVYVVSGDSVAWAINTDTGRVEWQLDGASDVSNVSGGPAPAVGDDLVVFGFGSGEMQAAFRKGGLRRWDATVAGKRRGIAASTVSDLTGDPVIAGDTVYAGSYSGRIVAVNADSGSRIWTAKDGALGPVWPAGGSIFAVTDRNELVRLDGETGTRIWGTKLPFFVREDRRRRVEIVAHYGPIIAGGRVLVASNDGLIRSFDPTSGAQISAIEVPGGATSNPVVAGNTLYIVSSTGMLHAIR